MASKNKWVSLDVTAVPGFSWRSSGWQIISAEPLVWHMPKLAPAGGIAAPYPLGFKNKKKNMLHSLVSGI